MAERYGGNKLPRVVLGEHEDELAFDGLSIEPLVIVSGARIVLRLPQSRSGSETLVARAGPGDWQRFDFDDKSLKAFPGWVADMRPHDHQHGGYTELVHVAISDLTFNYYRHGGYLLRELQFRLAPDGRSVELLKLQRAPLESRNRGRFEPEWVSARLLDQVDDQFRRTLPMQLQRDPKWTLDETRIVSFYACPTSGPPDRLDVLFGLHEADDTDMANYRTELWRLRRIDGQWQREPQTYIDLPSNEVLNLQNANYDEVRECMKVY